MSQAEIRNDWTKTEISEIFHSPIMELAFRAASVHRKFHNPNEVQVCTLLSVKTGGCSEDCKYCSQSVRYDTGLKVERLLEHEQVMEKANMAKENGSTRFCMGSAWRNIRDNRDFDRVLEMVKGVNAMGMEVCCTLGMLTEEQAQKLRDAGLFAYNHNLDTSREYYEEVITTRSYDDRLETIDNVRKAGIAVCSGGIIGLGESEDDRISMLWTLSNMEKHPESVPVNALVPVEGTPMEGNKRVSVWDMIRMISTARIIMPQSNIRLSAGRNEMPTSEQALCFMAGANSIFAGDKLLTTPNPNFSNDQEMFDLLGLEPKEAFKEAKHYDVSVS
ncbi:biotin synthase BioB [Fulvitalea axinellae]